MAKVITGARAVISIIPDNDASGGIQSSLSGGGTDLAYIGNITITEDNPLVEVRSIGYLEPRELAAVAHAVSFTCTMIKLDVNAASSLGFYEKPVSETPTSEYMKNLLNRPELTMTLKDDAGNVLYIMTRVKWEGGEGAVDAGGIWTGNFRFRGIRGMGL